MSTVTGTLYNNSDGIFLDLAELDANTARVVVTLTTTESVGSDGKGTINYTHYMSASTTAQFQVTIATPIEGDYIVTLEGRTSGNVAIANNSFSTIHEYVSPPSIDDATIQQVSSGSEQINIDVGNINDNVTHLQFFFTEMDAPFRTCNIMIDANDCSNSTVVIDGSSATVNVVDVVGENSLDKFIFQNSQDLEYAIHTVNNSGRSGDYVTAQISPSANANMPVSLIVSSGSELKATPYSVDGTTDDTLAVRFTPGNQVTLLPDTHYILQVGSLYKQLADASFNTVDGDKYLVLNNNSTNWSSVADDNGVGGTTNLTLSDGLEVNVFVRAKNANSNGDGLSSSTTGVPGTPSGLPETPIFTKSTGGDIGTGNIELTIDGDITSTALDNGSAITQYVIDVSGVLSPTVVGNFIDTSNVATVTGLDDGTEYSIKVTATNANGSTESLVLTATPSTVPAELVFNNAESKPQQDVVSDLSSGEIQVAWVKNTDAGGASGAVTYSVQVSTDNAYGSLVKDVSNIDVETISQKFSGLTNGTSYYVRIRASNTNGDSEWTELEHVLVPSRAPNASEGTLIDQDLLNSFIVDSTTIGSSGGFKANVSTLVGNTDLVNIDVNGGYVINVVKFELTNGTNTVTSDWVNINTTDIDIATGSNGDYTCNMYLGNAVYTLDTNAVSTNIVMTDARATTDAASFTETNEELTFAFTAATNADNEFTLPLTYKLTLKESVPTETDSGEIVYGGYGEIRTQTLTSPQSVTFASLTNGYRYKLGVVTTSEQPLKYTQVNLRDISDSDEVESLVAMPFGSPEMAVSAGSSTDRINIQVGANGRQIHDGYLFHPGQNGTNAYEYTNTLNASTTSGNAINNDTFYGSGADTAPFSKYVDKNQVTQNFNYIANEQQVGVNGDAASYITLVSGQNGHYTLGASDNAIADLNGN